MLKKPKALASFWRETVSFRSVACIDLCAFTHAHHIFTVTNFYRTQYVLSSATQMQTQQI